MSVPTGWGYGNCNYQVGLRPHLVQSRGGLALAKKPRPGNAKNKRYPNSARALVPSLRGISSLRAPPSLFHVGVYRYDVLALPSGLDHSTAQRPSPSSLYLFWPRRGPQQYAPIPYGLNRVWEGRPPPDAAAVLGSCALVALTFDAGLLGVP